MSKIRSYLVLRIIPLLLLLVAISSEAQDIFNDDILHEIRFSTSVEAYEDSLKHLRLKRSSSKEYRYLPVSINVDGVSLDSVGIRYKGASSYQPDFTKKSLKVDFNEFVKGQKLQGLRKLNLHNSFTDPSFMRDPLVYTLFEKMGVRAPRTSYAQIYFNGEYKGLFQVVEQVDKSFISGKVFKNMGWDNLDYRGTMVKNYRSKIDLKGKDIDSKWTEFIDLMKTIEDAEGDQFADLLETQLDVDVFLKVLAVYTATNNYDSVLKSGRNWYLALPEDETKFLWIPWDLNMSFSAVFPSQHESCNVFPNYFQVKTDKKTIQFYDDSEFHTHVDRFWDFGDGSISQEINPLHKYRKNGTYEVCLTLKILDYCDQQICKKINVKEVNAECANLPFTDSEAQDKRKFHRTIDRLPECCEEWGELCENYLKKIKDQEVFRYGFFPDESSNYFVQKILGVGRFRARYKTHMCYLLEEVLTEQFVEEFIDNRINLIDEALRLDPFSLEPYDEFLLQTGKNDQKRNLRNLINSRIQELHDFKHCNTN